MRKSGKAIVIILILFMVFIVNKNRVLYTATSTTDYYIATADLNIRAGAGTGHAIISTLQKGDEVEILSKKGNWSQIKYSENTGYVYSTYLKYSRTLSAVSDAEVRTFRQTMSYIAIGIFAIIILFVCFSILRKIRDRKLLNTVTKSNRGTRSERNLVLKLLKNGIPAHTIFHDLYLEKHSGNFSQIDLAVITEVGIVVFEVKDYSGWIFGRGNQSQWTKMLARGRQKYSFYNPIMQNNNHIVALRKKLRQFGNIPFYSIVVFYGNCVLKDIDFVPHGTFLVKSNRVLDVMGIIMKSNESLKYTNEEEVVKVLKDAVNNGGDRRVQIQHIENVNDMLGRNRIFD